MKIVIDIPIVVYDEIINFNDANNTALYEAIRNGTPLPKGYGKLIDADKLIKAIEKKSKRLKNLDTINGLCGAVALIYDAEAIIEANKTKKG